MPKNIVDINNDGIEGFLALICHPVLKWIKNISGYWFFGFFSVVIICFSLLGRWVVLPLRGGIYPTAITWKIADLDVPFYGLLVFLLVCSLSISKIKPLLAVLFSWLTIFLIASIPANILLNNQDIVSEYIEQSKTRLAITEISRDAASLNVNNQPLFEPITDIENAWDQLHIVFAMLDITWFFAFFMAIGLHGVFIENAKNNTTESFASGIVIVLLLIIVNINGINRFLISSDNAYKVVQLNPKGKTRLVIDWCEKSITINSALSSSDALMTQCLLAVYKHYGTAHPLVSYVGLVWKKGLITTRLEVGSEPLFIYTYKKLLSNNNTLRQTLKSTLDRSLLVWINRFGEQIILNNIKKELKKNHFGYALQHLNSLPDEKSLVKNYYMAFLNNKMHNTNRSSVNYKIMLASIEFKPIKADILCGLGDTYVMGGNFLSARKAYIACRELDNTYNYRVIKALSGT